MRSDDVLADVLAEQAESRPDPHEVLASVHARLDHPRRPAVGRSGTVLAAAAAVAAVAVTAAVVAARPSDHPNVASPGEPTPSATHAALPITSTSAAHKSLLPHQARVTSSSGYSTIAAGWLPGPSVQVEADRSPTFEERDYDSLVDGVHMDVIIYLEADTALPARTEAGSDYQDLTINGHPARAFISDNATIVAIDLGNGTIAYAGPSVVSGSAISSAQITAIAIHVARDIQYDRHDSIPADASGRVTPTARSGSSK